MLADGRSRVPSTDTTSFPLAACRFRPQFTIDGNKQVPASQVGATGMALSLVVPTNDHQLQVPCRATYPFQIRTNFFQPVTYVTGVGGPSRVRLYVQ
jgi:hypothetical protein